MTRTGGRADGGRTGELWRAGKREAYGRTSGRGAKERRTGEQVGGRAHKHTRAPSGRADDLAGGRTGGRADGGGQWTDGQTGGRGWVGARTGGQGDGRADDGFPKVKLLI